MLLSDLDSLRCFEAAAARLSFSAAARAVALSPPAFSERIRRLEEQLGAQLFRRSTRRVSLTLAGERLLPQARRAMAEARRCAEVVRAAGERAPFELIVGTRYELGLSWLLPALPRLARQHPERGLHLRFGDSPDLLMHVRDQAIDAAVTSARISSAALDYVVLHEETYVFVAAPRLVRKKPLRSREQARDHVLLDAHAELPLFRYFLDAHPSRDVWAFGRVERLGTIAAIRARALTGFGVAVLPHYFVRDDLARGRLLRLMPQVKLQSDHFRLVWRRNHQRENELRELAAELRELPIR